MVELELTHLLSLALFPQAEICCEAQSFNPSMSPRPLGRGLNPAGHQSPAPSQCETRVKLVPSQASRDISPLCWDSKGDQVLVSGT